MAAIPVISVFIFCCICSITLGDTDWDACPSGCSYQVQQRFVTVMDPAYNTYSQRQFQLCKDTNQCEPNDADSRNCSDLQGFMTDNMCYKLASASGASSSAFGACSGAFARLVPALLFELRDSFLEVIPYILKEAESISAFPYAIWTGGYSQNGLNKWQIYSSETSSDFAMVNSVWDSWVQAPPANSSTKYCLAIVVESSTVVNMEWLDCSAPSFVIKQALCMLQGRRAVFNLIPGTISLGNSTQSLTLNGLSTRWFCGLACKRQDDCQTAIYCPSSTTKHSHNCYTTNVKYTDSTESLGFNISTSTTECYILDRVW